MNFTVEKEQELLEFLLEKIKNKSKNTIKSLLSHEMVLVNKKVITKYNYLLKKNYTVEIIKKINDIDIIYEDNNIIVVNKPSGLLSISTEKETEKTLYKYISDYVKKSNKNEKIFVVHRLDKDTSGIVIFSKNQDFKNKLQQNWNDEVIRNYYAVVEGILEKKSGTIKSYLKENSFHKTYSSNKGELAITNYEVIKTNDLYSLLKVNIKTGKKNQIRVHLSDINHPIVGDKKYGSKIRAKRLMLCAYNVEFKNNSKYKFEIPYPEEFKKYIKA